MKNYFNILIILLSTLSIYGQDNLFEALAKYDGQEFIRYSVSIHSDGTFEYGHFGHNSTITIKQNKFGKPSGLEIYNKVTESIDFAFVERRFEADHYTQPAYIRHYTDYRKKAYMMIDDVLFAIPLSNEDMTKYGDSDGYGFCFVPVKPQNTTSKEVKKEEPKKKKKKKFGSFKALIAEAKAKAEAMAGNALPELLRDVKTDAEFMAKIDNYIASMRKKQAQNPLSSAEKAEVATIKRDGKKILADIEDYNMNSEEGKAANARYAKALGGGGGSHFKTYTIENVGSSSVVIGYNGWTTSLSAGSTYDQSCGSPVYYMHTVSGSTEAGAIISDGSSCGKTFKIQ